MLYQESTHSLWHMELAGTWIISNWIWVYFEFRSGKSFTMHGDENGDIGILPRFIRDLLGIVENSGFGVHVSIMQSYRDWIIDLLKDVKELAVYEWWIIEYVKLLSVRWLEILRVQSLPKPKWEIPKILFKFSKKHIIKENFTVKRE